MALPLRLLKPLAGTWLRRRGFGVLCHGVRRGYLFRTCSTHIEAMKALIQGIGSTHYLGFPQIIWLKWIILFPWKICASKSVMLLLRILYRGYHVTTYLANTSYKKC